MKISIYAACHKRFEKPFGWKTRFLDYIRYLEVGAFYHEEAFCELRDDTGDSISDRNRTYNELTGQYWIWKNDTDSEIVGLCHYRRYFEDPRKKNWSSPFLKLLRPGRIKEILREYDFIGIKTGPFEMSCRDRIDTPVSALRTKDIPIVREILFEKYGKDCAEAFDTILDRNWNYLYNMFITSKEKFDAYSEWLFPVLEEIEKRIDAEELVGQEKRIVGLWGEYLLNVFLEVKRYSVYDTDFVYFDI